MTTAEPFSYTSEIAIPVARWAKDHWSTLAYLETRAVDHDGIVANASMRTHARRHPLLLARGPHTAGDGSKYPTRLQDGDISDHDDWDCLWDACVAGLLELPLWTREEATYYLEIPRGSRGRLQHYDGNFSSGRALPVTVRFTEEGFRVAGLVRIHRARGGNFAEFRL